MFTLWYDFEEDNWNVSSDEDSVDFTGTKEECLDYIGSAEYAY